jgi:glucokinase
LSVPWVLGIDLGGTNVRAAVIGQEGSVHSAVRKKLGEDKSPPAVVACLVETAREAMEPMNLKPDVLAGIGVGVAGQIRMDSGIVANGPNLGWREVPLGSLLSVAFGRSVKIVNDVEAITWGEASFGSAKGFQDVLVVFVGTGVGAGLIVRGQLVHGSSGVAAEIGHVKVEPGGEPCGCGSRGCLEAYLGGGNLAAHLKRCAKSTWPALLTVAGCCIDAIHPGMVEQLLEQGDLKADALWNELSLKFGVVLANAVTLLNPAVLVLGGTLMRGCRTLRRRSEKVLREQVLAVASEKLKIVDAALGDDGGILGAAALALLDSGRRTALT